VLLANVSEPLPTAEQLTSLTATERKRFEQTVSVSELFIALNAERLLESSS
jgi:hypothetical protein